MLFLVFLAGCTRIQLETQAAALNTAVTNSENEQLLLNAVRASLDLPISITRLKTFSGKDRTSGKLSPSFPFGGDASRIFNFGPEVSFSPGISSAEYANVNVASSLEKLNNPIKNVAYIHLIRNGYDPLLLSTLMFNRFEVHQELYAALKHVKKHYCISPSGKNDPSCWVVDHPPPLGCKNNLSFAKVDKGENFASISNVGKSRCEYSKFQSFYHLLRISGLVVDLIVTEVAVEGEDKKGKPIVKTEKRHRVNVYFQNEYVRTVFDQLKERMKLLSIAEFRKPLKAETRSPKGVVSYLGELIRLQSAGNDKSPLMIMTHSGVAMTVFNVRTGRMDHSRYALSVIGPDGIRYSIPYPNYASSVRDQSLRVLSATSDLINIAIAEKELPSPSTLVLR